MTFLFLIAITLLAINLLPGLWKDRLISYERYVWATWLGLVLAYIIMLFGMNFFELEPRGAYTKQVISLLLAIQTIISFGILRNTWRKIGFIVIALPMLFIQAVYFPLGMTGHSLQLSNNRSVETVSSGFLGCGESIRLIEYKYLFFKKELYSNNSLCLTGIYKLEAGSSDNEVLIYHSGEFDLENPYRFVLPINGVE